MRIAVQNAFPNHPQTVAESEWIRRFSTACSRLKYEAIEVVTSDDILRLKPDCVLLTHEVSPKLTDFPTLMTNWNPPDFFAGDPQRLQALLSVDGHLCGSTIISSWIDDFITGRGKRPIIHDGLFLPSSPDCGPSGRLPANLAIMYAGVHWDGSRHGAIFAGLENRVPMKLYGPAQAWVGRENYCGTLPFDGVSVINALKDSGVALCLHKAAHRLANCPTMRIFEAAAAGALIITNDFKFARDFFRDSVLYIDTELPAPAVVEQIVSHFAWASKNLESASRLAQRSNALFRQALNLERMIEPLPEFVDKVKKRRFMCPAKGAMVKSLPTVEYIVRCGTRSVETVRRALDSLAAQTYGSIAVILVEFHPVAGLAELMVQYAARFKRVRRVVVANNGIRSTAWWAGLHALNCDFFAMLDDDDTLHSNHVATIMQKFEDDPTLGFVHSGLIRVEDDPGCFVSAPQFWGPAGKVVEERREIIRFERERLENLSPATNVVGNHTWICRRSLLDEDSLIDPRLEWAEDVYFTALMSARGKVGFTGMATANWHWRSSAKDNWTLSSSPSEQSIQMVRWRMRLQDIDLPAHTRVAAPINQYDVEHAVRRDSL